jgi:hypothetical protein
MRTIAIILLVVTIGLLAPTPIVFANGGGGEGSAGAVYGAITAPVEDKP